MYFTRPNTHLDPFSNTFHMFILIEGNPTHICLFIIYLNVLIGILEYETKELLLQHIDKVGYYSLWYLNQQITGFELGFMEMTNRPSPITLSTLRSKDHKLKQEGTL